MFNQNGNNPQGFNPQGNTMQGNNNPQGFAPQGAPQQPQQQGFAPQGFPQGAPQQQGFPQGAPQQQGFAPQGMPQGNPQGLAPQGMPQGNPQGFAPQGGMVAPAPAPQVDEALKQEVAELSGAFDNLLAIVSAVKQTVEQHTADLMAIPNMLERLDYVTGDIEALKALSASAEKVEPVVEAPVVEAPVVEATPMEVMAEEAPSAVAPVVEEVAVAIQSLNSGDRFTVPEYTGAFEYVVQSNDGGLVYVAITDEMRTNFPTLYGAESSLHGVDFMTLNGYTLVHRVIVPEQSTLHDANIPLPEAPVEAPVEAPAEGLVADEHGITDLGDGRLNYKGVIYPLSEEDIEAKKGTHITGDEEELIVALDAKGLSNSRIGDIVGRPRNSIGRVLKDLKENDAEQGE